MTNWSLEVQKKAINDDAEKNVADNIRFIK